MTVPSDEQLITWHNEPVSGTVLAAREGIETKWLHSQWGRLRRAGRIASGGRGAVQGRWRPRPSASHDGDGRPTVGWFEDPLLEKLVQVHHEPRPDLVDLSLTKATK